METLQFPLDKGYFGLHLVLEHQDLRRMDDGGRCEMSKMEPVKDMAAARNEGLMARAAW